VNLSQLFPLFYQSPVSDTPWEIKFIPFFLLNKFLTIFIIYYTLHNHGSTEDLTIGLQDTYVPLPPQICDLHLGYACRFQQE
jgi:hypothetical protein